MRETNDRITKGLAAIIPIIAQNLKEASAIAAAAETCLTNSDSHNAVKIVIETEQLLFEATTPMNAASMLKRIADD